MPDFLSPVPQQHAPGWARPSRIELTHWWRPDGRPACQPTGTLSRYTGPKLDVETLRLVDVCVSCAMAVEAAVAVLGPPS